MWFIVRTALNFMADETKDMWSEYIALFKHIDYVRMYHLYTVHVYLTLRIQTAVVTLPAFIFQRILCYQECLHKHTPPVVNINVLWLLSTEFFC